MSELEKAIGSLFDPLPFDEIPESLTVYWCPICKVGTGDRAWHKVGRAGLIPQTQEEHTCVKVDVAGLLTRADGAEKTIQVLLTVLPQLIVEAAEDFKTAYLDGRTPELSEEKITERLTRIVEEKFSG